MASPAINRYLDLADYALCRIGLMRTARFEDVLKDDRRALYAGKLRRALPQSATHYGMTPYFPSRRNIPFDVSGRMPLPDNSIKLYQSEDVFEHLPISVMPGLINDIHRVLVPGGLFRLSLPDYGFDGYNGRVERDAAGEIIFDPEGGGRMADGKVIDGGHLWFPTYGIVKDLFDRSDFADDDVRFLHYTERDGSSVLEPIDYSLGPIQRTPDHDPRSQSPRRAQSLVIDARKRGTT